MLLNENSINNKKHKEVYTASHVAIIMDGNGRWAINKGKSRINGHKAGVESIRRAINFALNNHLKSLTLYAFSSENWNRPKEEVLALMHLFLLSLENETENIHKQNIRLRIIGNIKGFNKKVQEYIYFSENLTKDNDGLNLNIAANYGGRWDIIESVKKITNKVYEGLLHPDQITEETLSAYLSIQDQSPIDLVIRTGGEHRISNFLLWQIAYAELYFTNVLWPDFNEHVFKVALDEFILRERRYGTFKP